MLLKDFLVHRPEKTVLQRKTDKNGNMTINVQHVICHEYDPVTKYTRNKKVVIGRLVDEENGTMIPNEKFEDYYPELFANPVEQPEIMMFADEVDAGSCIAVEKIMEDIGILDILRKIYDQEQMVVLTLILLFICIQCSTTFQEIRTFFQNHMIPFLKVFDDSYVCKFLEDTITKKSINEFMTLWNEKQVKLNPEEIIWVGFDSTNFNTMAQFIELADFGPAKDDKTKPIVNWAVAVTQEDNIPLAYDLYPGSIVDMVEADRLIEKMYCYGHRGVGTIWDRGYYSEHNLNYLDEKGYHFIMMGKIGHQPIRNAIEENRSILELQEETYLHELQVSGIKTKCIIYGKERYLYLYYDSISATNSKNILLTKIGILESRLKKLVGHKLRKNANLSSYKKWFVLTVGEDNMLVSYAKKMTRAGETILHKTLKLYGYFALVSSVDMEPDEILLLYKGRDNIEKFFRSIQWGENLNVPRVHDNVRLEAKIHLAFLSGIIRNRLYGISKELKNSTGDMKNYTVPSIIRMLEQVKATVVGKPLNYIRNYPLTAKQKLIFGKLNIDEAYINKKIKSFRDGYMKLVEHKKAS